MKSDAFEADSTAGTSSVWLELEAVCDEAIEASRHVGACLDEGVAAVEFVPLLRRELDLARTIGRQLKDIAPADVPALPDGRAAARDRLAHRLHELLDLEKHNQRLLSRRGVVISGSLVGAARRSCSPKSATYG